MQIELSQSEVETLSSALESWEQDSGYFITSLLGAMVMGDKKNDDYERKQEAARIKSEAETKERKIKSTLLRAKLMQAGMSALTNQA